MSLCLVPAQRALQPPGEGRRANSFWDSSVLLARRGLSPLSASVTNVLLLDSPLRLCLYLPFPRPSSRMVPLTNLPRAQCPAHISHLTLNFQDWEIAIFQSLQSFTQSFAEQEQGIFKCKDERDREAVIHTLRLVSCFLTQAMIWEISKLDCEDFRRRILM